MSEKDKNKDQQGFSGDENNESNFGTPQNYFESFSSRLFSKIKADDELKDYPLLSSMQKQNPFAVPAAYFEVKEEMASYPLLSGMRRNAFGLPASYFDEVTTSVKSGIELSEELKPYTTLVTAGNENVFVLPESYFEEFYGNVKAVVSPARVIPLYGRVLKSYKFAVAAAVALLLTLTVILLNQKTEIQPQGDCNTFACLSKKEIVNSAAMQYISEESIIEMIDVKALSDSLSLRQNGKTEKIDADEISAEIDVNTLTEEL